MNDLLEILKYTIPSIVVGVTAYMLMKQFLNSQQKPEQPAAAAAAAAAPIVPETKGADLTPVRMQAYERLILFLERIDPNSLIVRVHRPGMTALQLQNELLMNVRNEYEHNSTQQLYVSSEVWGMITGSKDAVIQVINLASKKMSDKSSGLDLSNVLIEIIGRSGVHPTKDALEGVKAEARQLF
jgi:hypothetical protein